MSLTASFVLFVLLSFTIVKLNCQILPLVHYYWNEPVDGVWPSDSNWTPYGFPRDGHHVAHFEHIGATSYTVNQTLPIIVGQIIVLDDVTLNLNSTAGVLIDPWALAPPVISTMDQTVGFPILINVEDFSLGFFEGNVQVYAVNNRTGDYEYINATFDGDYGEFNGSLMTNCDGANPISVEGDGIINVLPFDIIFLMYRNKGNETATAQVVLAFMDLYMQSLTWPVVSTSLMAYAAQKTIRKLTNLKQQIVYILHNLPPYEDNDCCPNEEYRYPLPIADFAEETYEFYHGNIFGPVGCNDLITYCHKIELYLDDLSPAATPIVYREINIPQYNDTTKEPDSQLMDSLEEKITIKSILQALFGDKFSV